MKKITNLQNSFYSSPCHVTLVTMSVQQGCSEEKAGGTCVPGCQIDDENIESE